MGGRLAADVIAPARTMSDAELEREAELLARKVSALRYATSAAGVGMLAQFRDRLAAVRVELERRKT